MRGNGCIMKLGRFRLAQAALVVFLLFLCLGAFWLLQPGASALPPASEELLRASEGLNDYDLTLRLNPEEGALAISQTLHFRNHTGEALDTLVLRTWLNAYQREETSPAATEELYDLCYPQGFSPGSLQLFDVTWNGQPAPYRYLDEAQTALEITIPSLEAGARGTLSLRCVGIIPHCAHRTGYADGVWQLGNVIPLLSRLEEGRWRTDGYYPVGDPFVSDCANFRLTVHVPQGYVPACSAYLTRGEGGAWRGQMLAARDVALCISRDYRQVTARQGDTLVASYARTEAGARRALGFAKKALEIFESLYGHYPYPALTLCSVDFPFGGMEYPGLCMIGNSCYLESMADSLELVAAHETAHQWFGLLVGSDAFNQPWQDEALCEYAMLRYVRARYGAGSFDTLKFYRVDSPMQESIPGRLTPGSPIDSFSNLNDYSAVVYGRGGALLLALDEMLPQGVDAFLKAYAQHFAFAYATREEFQAFLNAYAGMDTSPLLLDYLDTAQ